MNHSLEKTAKTCNSSGNFFFGIKLNAIYGNAFFLPGRWQREVRFLVLLFVVVLAIDCCRA